MLGLSAALFGACSSDENINNGNGPRGDEAYVSLSIALPTTSRAARAYQDEYKPGENTEYNVEDLKIVYFTKPENVLEGDYDNYEVASEPKDVNKSDLIWTPSTDGITTVATLPVQKVNNTVKAVLVLINNNQTLTTINAGTKFSALNTDLNVDNVSTLTTKDGTTNYFFMSNSPLSDGTTLVPVTAYNREETAKANTKAVYVERAVAKVTFDKGSLKDNGGNWEVKASAPYDGDKVVFTSWALDVTNKKEYPVRKYKTDWNDWHANGTTDTRFLATKLLETSKQRTYWATDPNYDKADMPVYSDGVVDKTKSTDFKYISESDVNTTMAASAYCTENTFDVTHMKQGETTRVIVKALYQPQTNLEDGLNVSDFTAGQTWYRVGNSSKACNDAKLKEKVLAAVQTVTAGATAVNLVSGKIAAGEQKDFTAEMFTVTDGTSTDRAMNDDELAAVQNALGKLTVFKDGICYYVARIRHFNDEQLGGRTWDGTDYTQNADDIMRQNFLGRYGIVRNNWYQLTINSVSAPGTPTIPIPGDTPDDEQNYYLQTSVKIMDWAVRKQGLDF